MKESLDDRARDATRSLHEAAANRRPTLAPRRRHGRELALVAAAIALVVGAIAVVATNSDDQALITPQTRPATTVAPVPSCADPGPEAPWPRTGPTGNTSWSRDAVVSTFARVDLEMLVTEVPTPLDQCRFEVHGYDLTIEVVLGRNAAGDYYVSSFRSKLPDDLPLSIQINGRDVDVHTAACSGCSQVLEVTYADAEATLTSTTGDFTGTMAKKASGPGTLVLRTRDTRRRLVWAIGFTLPAGNFAAS